MQYMNSSWHDRVFPKEVLERRVEPNELLEDVVPVQTHPNVQYMKTWRAAQVKYTKDGKTITKRKQLDTNCTTKEEIQESFAKRSRVLQEVYDTFNDGPDEEAEEE